MRLAWGSVVAFRGYSHGATDLPRELKDAIGRENILLMDNYSQVNALWPWHHY